MLTNNPSNLFHNDAEYVLTITLLILILGIGYWKYTQERGARVPAARGYYPLIGHLLVVLRSYDTSLHCGHDEFLCLMKKNPHIKFPKFRWILPLSPVYYMTVDPQDIECILKTNFDSWIKGDEMHSRLADVLGDGIFTTDGEAWRVQRKTASNLFSVKNFREFVSKVFSREMEVLYHRMDAAADNKEVVDMQELLFRFTLDSFMQVGFGERLGCLEDDKPVAFAAAFDRAQATINKRFFVPAWRLVEFITSAGQQHRKDLKILREFGANVVRKRLVAEDAGQTKNTDDQLERRDILSFFLALPTKFSEKVLTDYVLNFIMCVFKHGCVWVTRDWQTDKSRSWVDVFSAGRDTTAQALSWCLMMVSQKPDVEQQLLGEIDTVIGNSELTYDKIKELKYAKAVFYETLRLFPSVPKDMKYAAETTTLPDGTVIKKGDAVVFNVWSMGRLPQLWGEDYMEFKPERFLDFTPSPFHYPVFNAGPRICLGKQMAETEGVFMMCMIVKRYRIELLEPRDVMGNWYRVSLTLPMRDGLPVRLTRRA